MPSAPVAIEINERWLKVAVAKPGVRRRQLLECLVKPLAGLSDAQITQTVVEIFRQLKLKPKPLILGLPRNLVTVRNLHLPSQQPHEVGQMIDVNVIRMVPYRKEEVLFAYQLLGADEIGYAKVLLAIAHRELVKRHVSMLESTGMAVDRILLSSHGVWGWTLLHHTSDMDAQALSLVLDVDSAFTDCFICDRDHLLFSRSITIGSDQLTDEAGLAKLMSELTQSLEIFQNEEMDKRPVKLFLSGAAHLAALESALGQGVGIPVIRVTSPLALLAKGKPPTTTEFPAGVSISAVAGLIAGEKPNPFSFLLPELQIKQALRKNTHDLVVCGSLCLSLLALGIGALMGRTSQQHAYLSILQARNEALRQEVGTLVTQSKHIELAKSSLRARQVPLQYLAELQRLVPPEIAIEFLGLDEQQLGVIRGKARQPSDVFTFITVLERSKSAGRVETKYTRRKKVKEQEVTEFELTLQVRRSR